MNEAVTLDGEQMIVLTHKEYDALREDAGDLALIAAERAAHPDAPRMPADLLDAMLGGLHPLTAWRKAAGLSQAGLSRASGVRAATISEIEAGRIDPRLSTLRALAGALNVGLDDIVPDV